MNKITGKILKELSYQTGKYLVPPEFLSLIVTMKCNFKCLSCSIWQKAPEAELGEAEWGRIIEKLKSSLKPETFVEINGGEPLIRKDLTIFLIKELKKYFKRVALNSNGLLIDEKILDELQAAGLDILKISLYSLNKETHNNLRGHALAFEHAKKAIELISNKNIALEVGLLITAQNIKEAPELIKYLQTLPNTAIILQSLDEKVESVESKNLEVNVPPMALWPIKEDVNAFFDWVMNNRSQIKNSVANLEAIRQYYLEPKNILRYRCFAGQRNLVVYPSGEAALCFKGAIIGNLVKDDLKTVLKKAEVERKKIKNCLKYCRIVGCNFSRGLKEALRDKFLKK
jgi:MoaA/NifB/PqqE/SkfB family radical SAM enzyme